MKVHEAHNIKIIICSSRKFARSKYWLGIEAAQSKLPEAASRCSLKKVFLKIHKKTPVPESLFNKVAVLRPKKDTLAKVFSCEFCEIFKNTFFTEYFRVTTSQLQSKREYIKVRRLLFINFG